MPTRSVLAFPAKPITIALVTEKREAVAALLLRAGVPKEVLRTENRSQAVIDHAISYIQEPTARILHKYNLGRQFVTNGMVSLANKAADSVLPLLLAETTHALQAHTREAEHFIETDILPRNVHSS